MKKSTRNLIIILIILAIATVTFLIIQNKNSADLSPGITLCKCVSSTFTDDERVEQTFLKNILGSNADCSELNRNENSPQDDRADTLICTRA